MSRDTWRDALAAYASPATLALLLLGFAAGLPAVLVFSTLSVWLREAGVSGDHRLRQLDQPGLRLQMGVVADARPVAIALDRLVGRRRSWLVLSQALIAVGLIGMALCNPQHNLTMLIALAVVVAFSSATQDIAIDAYRLEIAEDKLQATLPPAT